MASAEWTKIGEETFTGDAANMANECRQFVMSRFGFSQVGSSGNYVIYRYGSTGLYMAAGNSNGLITFTGCSKNADGSFNVSSTYGASLTPIRVPGNDTVPVVYESMSLGSLTAYRVRNTYTQDAATIIPFTLIDYFTEKQRMSFTGPLGSTSTLYAPVSEGDGYEALTVIPMGGGSYPGAYSVTVAAPVMLKTNTFYGYMESSSCLYSVNGQNSAFGTQIQIAGTTFTCLGGNMFVR